MTIVRVFADPALMCDVTTPDLTIRSYRTPGEVIRALAFLRWQVGTDAVVDLGLHGLLGADVVDYIASRHPCVGLWGIADLCSGDVAEIIKRSRGQEGSSTQQHERVAAAPDLPALPIRER